MTFRSWPLAGRTLTRLASISSPVARLARRRLGADSVLVAGAVFVIFRLANIYPWDVPTLDMHAYWQSRDVINYSAYSPFVIGAFLYSPAFAHAILPLTALSWPVFAAAWTAILVGAFVWLAGRWSLPLLLFSFAVPLEIYLGQVDILIGAAIVIGFRYPAAWAFPLLTKVAPGVGLLWFAFRREWRSLLIALSATAAIAGVSAIAAPDLWRGWLDLLFRSFGEPQPVLWSYLAVPVWLRLPVAVALLWWGARTDRYWTVPAAATLTMPILWANIFTILVGAIPLLPLLGETTARAWLFGKHPETVRDRVLTRPGEYSPAT
jgi:hypothetical protein